LAYPVACGNSIATFDEHSMQYFVTWTWGFVRAEDEEIWPLGSPARIVPPIHSARRIRDAFGQLRPQVFEVLQAGHSIYAM